MFKYVPSPNNRRIHYGKFQSGAASMVKLHVKIWWNFLLLCNGTYLNRNIFIFCLLFLRISWQIYDFYRDGFRYVHIEIHLLQMHIFKPNFLNCIDHRNYYISKSNSILLLHIFKHNLVITTDLKMTYNSQLHI